MRQPRSKAEAIRMLKSDQPGGNLRKNVREALAEPFRVQVQADGSGTWAGNGLTFASQAEAESYAADLARLWTLVRAWRVVRRDGPCDPTCGLCSEFKHGTCDCPCSEETVTKEVTL